MVNFTSDLCGDFDDSSGALSVQRFHEYDPDLGFRVRAYYPVDQGTITNKFGFNDDDYPLQKTPGIYRILVVGDSFGWAGGREGNYTAMLERQLDKHYGYHRIDIVNAGYPMTHTAEQLVMLKKYGLQYHPDLVILGFFVGNDFIDGNPNRKRIVLNGERDKSSTIFRHVMFSDSPCNPHPQSRPSILIVASVLTVG